MKRAPTYQDGIRASGKDFTLEKDDIEDILDGVMTAEKFARRVITDHLTSAGFLEEMSADVARHPGHAEGWARYAAGLMDGFVSHVESVIDHERKRRYK